MIAAILIGVVAGALSCSFGDYTSICDFTPAKEGAFRIVGKGAAAAKGPSPHAITIQYVVNGMPCKQIVTWRSGTQTAKANCVAQLNAGMAYHVVATTSAQNADHVGRVSISITPTGDAVTLRAPPISIRARISR